MDRGQSRPDQQKSEPYGWAPLLTHSSPLAENSPSTSAGAPEINGGYGGQNLLGLALMRVRDELIAGVPTRLTAPRAAR